MRQDAARLLKLTSGFIGSITLTLPPQHHRVDQIFRLLASNMSESYNELIEGWVYPRSTYLVNMRLWIKRYRDALSQFLFGLGNELSSG